MLRVICHSLQRVLMHTTSLEHRVHYRCLQRVCSAVLHSSACTKPYVSSNHGRTCIILTRNTRGLSREHHPLIWLLAVKQEGAPKNPRAVGEAIQAALKESPAIKSTSIAGPGFVNLVLHDEWLAARVDHMLQSGIACWAPQLKVHTAAQAF